MLTSTTAAAQALAGTPNCQLHPFAAWRDVAGEIFVITEDRAFHRLAAPTATDLLRAIAAGRGDPRQLTDLLVGRYQVEADRAAADVAAFVATLIAKKIAVESPVRPIPTP